MELGKVNHDNNLTSLACPPKMKRLPGAIHVFINLNTLSSLGIVYILKISDDWVCLYENKRMMDENDDCGSAKHYPLFADNTQY